MGTDIDSSKYHFDQIEISYDRQNGVGYRYSNKQSDVQRYALNLLKNYDISDEYTPYGLVGLGYEDISEENFLNDDSAFFNWGVGVKYDITKSVKLLADVRHIVRVDDSKDHLLFNIGVLIPFGKESKKMPPVEETAVIQPPKKPAVEKEVIKKEIAVKEKIETKTEAVVKKESVEPKVEKVEPKAQKAEPKENKITVKKDITIKDESKDSDNDGVLDLKDRCPDTPNGFEVDSAGCEVAMNLVVNYAFDSAVINKEHNEKIVNFANFLKAFPKYNTIIQGHTDSIGSKSYNHKLSVKRAQAVYDKLVELGVTKTRLSYFGYGELKPVAQNDTAQSRSKNRRAVTILINQYR